MKKKSIDLFTTIAFWTRRLSISTLMLVCFGSPSLAQVENAEIIGNPIVKEDRVTVRIKVKGKEDKPVMGLFDTDFRLLVDNKEVKLTEEYSPSEEFLKALYRPQAVERSNVFIMSRILKVGDYRKNYQRWHDTDVFPGCSIELPRLLHEFSISQFTFQTYEQFKSWESEHKRYLRKYGQSYEMFFINESGTLNFQLMVETIDKLIRDGAMSFFKNCDKRSKHSYRNYKTHQALRLMQ